MKIGINQHHQHKDAFLLMTYYCDKCGYIEKIWNSRDGVTPFSVNCKLCDGIQKHIRWDQDVYAPLHRPKRNDRVFVDCTKDDLANLVESIWDGPLKHKHKFTNKNDMLDFFMKEFKHGQPAIKVITRKNVKEFKKETRKRFEALYKESQKTLERIANLKNKELPND